MLKALKNIGIVNSAGKAIRTFWRKQVAVRRLQSLRGASTIKIIIGSSGTNYPGWTMTDIEYLNLLEPAHWERSFEKESIDAILAEHVWEHLTYDDGLKAAKQCFAYLKPGGHVRVAVPDGWNPDPTYIDWVRVGGTGAGADDHKMLYDLDSITRLFSEAGFSVKGLEYFNSNHEFVAVPWNVEDGFIKRSKEHDKRNTGDSLRYASLIIDAIKPMAAGR